MQKDPSTTHFGFTEVSSSKKQGLVDEVFHSVSARYDLMNDLMSLGTHRLWKRRVISMAEPREGQRILDVAGGTGDLTLALSKKVGKSGQVILADINESMIIEGRKRLDNCGRFNVDFVMANAECLPFADHYFDTITIGFGLRNVTDKDAALRSMFRILKPGGKFLVLEFSKPMAPIKPLYDAYNFNVLPKIGQWVANDAKSYQYLAESIAKHPDQQTLQSMMAETGFEDCEYINLSLGIVAIHLGYKY